MAIFDNVRNNWRKAEAATVVQQLLENHRTFGFVGRNAARYANALIGLAWQQSSRMYDGSRGVVPHKVAVAASALAHGAKAAIGRDPRDPEAYVLVVCLGQILQDVEQHDYLYTFNRLDEHLLGSATQSFSEVRDVIEDDMARAAAVAKASDEATRRSELGQGLDPAHVELMHKYGITHQNGQYQFQSYRYDRLQDAVNYAERATVRPQVFGKILTHCQNCSAQISDKYPYVYCTRCDQILPTDTLMRLRRTTETEQSTLTEAASLSSAIFLESSVSSDSMPRPSLTAGDWVLAIISFFLTPIVSVALSIYNFTHSRKPQGTLYLGVLALQVGALLALFNS